MLVGKLVATVKEASGGGGSAHLTWEKVSVDVKAAVTDDRTLTVKNTAQQVAVLYLVNPSKQMLSEYKICSAVAK